MTEYTTSFFSLFVSTENQLITMFLSGLLSSTILPGNSEILFTTLASQQIINHHFYSQPVFTLIFVATLGNSLGSMITYALGRLFPTPTKFKHRYTNLALAQSEKYGVWILLFSWLPVVGDLFCGIAGWLRFSLWQSILLITIGKFIRYLVLWAMLYPILKYAF